MSLAEDIQRAAVVLLGTGCDECGKECASKDDHIALVRCVGDTDACGTTPADDAMWYIFCNTKCLSKWVTKYEGGCPVDHDPCPPLVFDGGHD